MSGPIPQGASLVSVDGRLRVQFDWCHDRFAQTLRLDGDEVGWSIEGDDQEAWPWSPPLQQLLCQQIEGRDVILGVGAAGNGHWSLSVAPVNGGGLKFELACRCRESPTFLGSAYRHTESICLRSFDCHLSVQPVDRDTNGSSGSRLHLAAEGQGTHCWSYCIEPEATHVSQGP